MIGILALGNFALAGLNVVLFALGAGTLLNAVAIAASLVAGLYATVVWTEGR